MTQYVSVRATDQFGGSAGRLVPSSPYTGAVPGITDQFIDVNPVNLVIAATGPNIFLRSGAGNDALLVVAGRNVLDAGTGSNFMVGGTNSTDTFFVDGRGTGVTWSSIIHFHPGDDATIWGWNQGVSKMTWADGQGAAGYTGATVHIQLAGNGVINDSMTFVGYTVAQAQKFAMSAGVVQGNAYLHFAA
jgi:hypothetical protein